jgi:hypothetical protein
VNEPSEPADRQDVTATSPESAAPDATTIGSTGGPAVGLGALAPLVTALTALAAVLLGDAPWQARLLAFLAVLLTVVAIVYFWTHPGTSGGAPP